MARDRTTDKHLPQRGCWLWWLTLLISATAALPAMADCVSTGSGVNGWWPGDGNANNVFGTNNGTLQGGATASAPGLVNSAFSFDGTNGSVSIPNSPLLRPTNLTIETWVRFASLDSAGSGGSPAGDQYIVFRQNTRSSNFEGFDLSKTRVGGSDVFRFLIASASAQAVEIHSTTTISTGAWYHVAAVRGSNFVQIYVNGALERQTNISFPQDYGNFPLYLGSSGQASWDHKLKGNLDEVTFYSSALSSDEIAAVYLAGAAGKCKTPSITSQPQSVAVFAGSNVAFTVVAAGFGSLSYQWRSNTVPIPGATNPSLTLSNVQPTFGGDYTAVVTNLLGSATSAVVTLTVVPPPSVIVSVDFGDGGFGPKTGPAAIGQDASDYWNNLPGGGSVVNAQTARGNTSQATVTVPYGMNNWLIPSAASGDPMVDDYLEWTGGIEASASQLPTGIYDFYVYSHDSDIQLSVGSTSYGIKNAYEGIPLSHPPIWQENRQYVAFRNVAVTNGGSPVSISAGHVHQQDGIISGLQIVCNGAWILQQPTGLLAAVTSNFVLQVNAEASPAPSYRWFFNGNPLADGGRISGATSSVLSVTSAQVSDAGSYYAVVTNAGGATTSSVASVLVGFPPNFTQSPANQTNVTGTSAQFTATLSGDQPIGFQWYFNGAPLADDARHSGSTNTNLSISGIVESDAGNYTIAASNAFGVRTSAVATLTVLVPAMILAQPSDQYILTNMGAMFTVGVKGDQPLAFKWFFGPSPLSDGGRISGATTATLAIQNVQSNDLGGYSVVVSNAWGSATSIVATLSFATPRYINVNNGSPSTPYLTWASAATTIQNAIDAANRGDWIFVTNGTYQSGGAVVRMNQGNTVLNRVAAYKPLTIRSVNGPAVTTIRGGSQARCAYLTNGASISGFTLSGGSLNFNNPGYNDWDGAGVLSDDSAGVVVSNCVVQGNSGPYGGGANRVTLVNCLVAGNFAAGQGGGAYVCTLINCTVTANNATYGGGMGWCMVTNSIVFGNAVNPPWDNTNHFNTSFANSCTTPDPGGTGNITSTPIFVNAAVGNYRLQSNSPCLNAGMSLLPAGSVDLDGAPRIVDGIVDMGAYEYQHAPFILTQPTNQSVLIYSNVLFVVSALGDSLSYTWQKNGSDLVNDARTTGADAASLSISNLVAQDGGNYRVIVTNASGSVTSAVASLTLLGPPIISSQPVSRTVPAGTNVIFSVTASGPATLSYQWRFNNGELLAKTNSSLSLTNVQSANAGDYDVVITNIYGALTSSVATLAVVPAAPTIATQAVSRVASVGQTVSFNVAATGTEPLTCQWQFNASDLPGATGFGLTLQNVNSSHTGTYRAAVSNSAGFAFSTNVTLVVSPVLIWGQTNNFQLFAFATIPAAATNVIAIATAGSTDVGLPCLALRADGSIVPWGYSSRDLSPPTNAVDAVAISVGSSGGIANSMVLRSDGSVVGWNGTTKPPSPPPGPNSNFVAIAAGGSHQLALRDDGTVVAWGSNTSGVTNVPPNATNVVAIAAGTTHSLALRMDGTVVGWGLNTSGQATALTNAFNIVKLAASGNQSMGLRADGTIVGRIVTNNTLAALFYGPPPPNATNMIAVAAGSSHSLGLRADRTVTGWGQTNTGQLNVPPYATNVLAIAAGGGDSLALVPDPFAPPIPPLIGRPPLSRVLTAGRDAVLNALPSGGLPLRCQWYKDGNLLTDRTNQWLAVTNCQLADAGNYQLVAINDFASATSAVAVVTVALPPPTIKSPVKNGQTFSFTFDTFAGVLYIGEFANAPFGATWIELDRRLGNGSPQIITDTNSSPQPRFYRLHAIYPPPP